jgi:hypothetical protein
MIGKLHALVNLLHSVLWSLIEKDQALRPRRVMRFRRGRFRCLRQHRGQSNATNTGYQLLKLRKKKLSAAIRSN